MGCVFSERVEAVGASHRVYLSMAEGKHRKLKMWETLLNAECVLELQDFLHPMLAKAQSKLEATQLTGCEYWGLN